MSKMADLERTIEELYHNLFRMHSYVETTTGTGDFVGEGRPGILKRADLLLATSYGRAKEALPANHWGVLEPPK